MPKFMDFHDDLQLPGEAIQQITQDTKAVSYTHLDVYKRQPVVTV